jgi:hypothetical protein
MWIRRCRKGVRRAWRRWPSGLGRGAGTEHCQDGPVVASAVPGGYGQPGPALLPQPARSARIRATIASAGRRRAHGWSILPGAAALTNGTAAGRPCPAWHPPFVITTLVVLAASFVVMTNSPGICGGAGRPPASQWRTGLPEPVSVAGQVSSASGRWPSPGGAGHRPSSSGSGETPRRRRKPDGTGRSPYHLHTFCIGPAHAAVAVLPNGQGGVGGLVWLRQAGAFLLTGKFARILGGR